MKHDEYFCELCNGKKFVEKPALTKRLGTDPARHRVVKCAGCGLYSLFPRPSEEDLVWIYSNYAKQGDRVEVERKRIREVYPQKIESINKYVDRTGGTPKLLDIGAGLGGFVSVASSSGFDVVGVEYEREQAEKAKELFNVDLVCDTFENFSSTDGKKYDVVHLHHVLEHLRYPKSVLVKIKDKLSENGILILEVPNQFFRLSKEINVRLGRERNGGCANPYHHIHFFSRLTLARMLENAGYEVLELNELPVSTSGFKRFISTFFLKPFGFGVSSRMELIARPK